MRLIPLLMLFLIPLAFAATISGSIYDPDLNLAKDVILRIDTKPVQTFVSKEGTYAFTVQKGTYTITAMLSDNFDSYYANISVEVQGEGEFISDIILEPDLSEDEQLLNEDIEAPALLPNEGKDNWALGIVLFLAIAVVTFFFIKPRKKPFVSEDLSNQILAFIQKQGGRTTQKDIRKQFPVSEATISLAVRELEAKGKIEKFKQGKGNLIVLKN